MLTSKQVMKLLRTISPCRMLFLLTVSVKSFELNELLSKEIKLLYHIYSNQSPIAQTRPQSGWFSCEAAVSRSTRDHLVRLTHRLLQVSCLVREYTIETIQSGRKGMNFRNTGNNMSQISETWNIEDVWTNSQLLQCLGWQEPSSSIKIAQTILHLTPMFTVY